VVIFHNLVSAVPSSPFGSILSPSLRSTKQLDWEITR